jgi:hypothetical protein
MADVKISGLPASTTPLAGTEVLPIVQSGTTKQVSVANLTAGRPISTTGYQLGSGGIITEATTSRTLSATDNGKVIYCTSGSAVTIETATSLGVGFSCVVIQGGAGQVEITQGAGTTRVAFGAAYKSAGQYAAISILSPVADTFVVSGNITA